MKPNTQQITRLFGTTFRLTITFLFLFSGLMEWISRLDTFQRPLTPPKMGSRHYQLGHKLALLDADVKRIGPIDCIMVGSSIVDVGFNPDYFQSGYEGNTGQEIHCFNFGIDASSAGSTAALVKILVEDYHPRLLIIGTDARDYAVPREDRDPAAILESHWIKYRQGDFSLDGWLTEHSYFYRYRQHLSRLLRFKFEGTLWTETKLSLEILANGYTPIDRVASYINDPPDPKDDSFEVVYYSRILGHYQMLDENLDALESIMEYNAPGTTVILVEMPVSDGLYYFFDNGEKDYDQFIARVGELADVHQVLFWRTEPLDSIPDDGWSDYSHLNVIGAEIFSTWLGEQVGKLDIQKDVDDLQP